MSDQQCFSTKYNSFLSTRRRLIQSQTSSSAAGSGRKLFKGFSVLAFMMLVALFCLVIFTANTVNSQDEKSGTTAVPAGDVKSSVVNGGGITVEEIGESPLMKEPIGGSTVGGSKSAEIPVLGEDEDDDFEDYDTDDFAVLGNEWLLKEIKEIEEQIQTVSADDEDVGDVSTTKSPEGSNSTQI